VLLAFLLEERLPEHIGLNYMWIVGDVKEEITGVNQTSKVNRSNFKSEPFSDEK